MAELRYVDWDGLVYYDGKIKTYIEQKEDNYLKMGGFVLFSELPEPSINNVNYIYRIKDNFITDSDFDKPNVSYSGGTWVQVTNIDDSGVFLFTIFDESSIGQTAEILSNYYTKQEVDSLLDTVVTTETVTEIVTKEIETTVTETISEKVTEVVQDKVDSGEITVSVGSISYGEF